MAPAPPIPLALFFPLLPRLELYERAGSRPQEHSTIIGFMREDLCSTSSKLVFFAQVQYTVLEERDNKYYH